MAVAVYGFTLVVPLASIARGFPGGLDAWRREFLPSGAGWHDHRLAAMPYYDPAHAYERQKEWLDAGFRVRAGENAPPVALLCAQVDCQLGLRYSDCDWLEFDEAYPCVWWKGETPESIAVPWRLRDRFPFRRAETDLPAA